jgi:hypothetical protein
MKAIQSIAAAIGMSALLATGAFAQGSLISVDVSNVANNIAKNINVNVSQIPVNVQVPVDVAANVCGVAVTALGTATGQNTACKATSTSAALDTATLGQLVTPKQG